MTLEAKRQDSKRADSTRSVSGRNEGPVDGFKRATAACLRAVSECPEATVTYAADTGGMAGKRVRLPVPSRLLSSEEVSRLRGSADAMALRLRHHDPMLHGQFSMTNDAARDAFEALEQARCEAIGARQMPGVSQNLGAVLEDTYRRQGMDKVTRREDAPMAEVVRLMAREAMTGQPPPPSAKAMIDLWRDKLDPNVIDEFARLA
ncbi:MAG: cobaltochelatase subunit CobT, partial [Pseudomonadota bacterium]